jgi:single-stranded-DNA-specific exonuclease
VLESVEPLLLDGALSAGGATADLVRALERAARSGRPPEPVFAFGRIASATSRRRERVTCGRPQAGDGAPLKAVAFRAADGPVGAALAARRAGSAHLAGTLAIDRWGGGERAELRICDVAPVL